MPKMELGEMVQLMGDMFAFIQFRSRAHEDEKLIYTVDALKSLTGHLVTALNDMAGEIHVLKGEYETPDFQIIKRK